MLRTSRSQRSIKLGKHAGTDQDGGLNTTLSRQLAKLLDPIHRNANAINRRRSFRRHVSPACPFPWSRRVDNGHFCHFPTHPRGSH